MEISGPGSDLGRTAAISAAQGLKGEIITQSLDAMAQMKKKPSGTLGSSLGAKDGQTETLSSQLASQTEKTVSAVGKGMILSKVV